MNPERLKNIVFIDIETVSGYENREAVDEKMLKFWESKTAFQRSREEDTVTDEEFYFKKAGIFAEFGKIVAIGTGFLHFAEGDKPHLRVKTLYNDDENTLLAEFIDLLGRFDQYKLQFCAHNGKEFDYPYICRRMLIQGFTLPPSLNLMGKRPWDIPHLDTMELWKFGDYKHFTSLDLLAQIFGIESSKSDMSGADVNQVYYHEKDLKKIANYCSLDVVVTAKLFLRLTENYRLKDGDVQILDD